MRARVQIGSCMTSDPIDVGNVSWIVIFDEESHTPIVAIEQIGREVVHVTHPQDAEFPLILRRLGVRQEVLPVTPEAAVMRAT